jgi:hypothetical protein
LKLFVAAQREGWQWRVRLRGGARGLEFFRCQAGAERVIQIFEVAGRWNELNDFATGVRGGFARPFLRGCLGAVGARRVILREQNKRGIGGKQPGEAFAIFRAARGNGGNARQTVRRLVPAAEIKRGEQIELRFKTPSGRSRACVTDNERQSWAFGRVKPENIFAAVRLALHRADMGAHDRAAGVVNGERKTVAKDADELAGVKPRDNFR